MFGRRQTGALDRADTAARPAPAALELAAARHGDGTRSTSRPRSAAALPRDNGLGSRADNQGRPGRGRRRAVSTVLRRQRRGDRRQAFAVYPQEDRLRRGAAHIARQSRHQDHRYYRRGLPAGGHGAGRGGRAQRRHHPDRSDAEGGEAGRRGRGANGGRRWNLRLVDYRNDQTADPADPVGADRREQGGGVAAGGTRQADHRSCRRNPRGRKVAAQHLRAAGSGDGAAQRHARARAAGSPAGRRHGHRHHGQRAEAGLRRAQGQARAHRRRLPRQRPRACTSAPASSAAVGRRVDEIVAALSTPGCTDGSRVNIIIPPLAIDGPDRSRSASSPSRRSPSTSWRGSGTCRRTWRRC